MSKKNSSVNLKNGFQSFKDLSKIFIHFKKKLDSIIKTENKPKILLSNISIENL